MFKPRVNPWLTSEPHIRPDPLRVGGSTNAKTFYATNITQNTNRGDGIFEVQSPSLLPLNQWVTESEENRYTEQRDCSLFTAQIRWQGGRGVEPRTRFPCFRICVLKSLEFRGASCLEPTSTGMSQSARSFLFVVFRERLKNRLKIKRLFCSPRQTHSPRTLASRA
jgi:hypothetical protein